MRLISVPPFLRLSFGLIALTISVLFMGELLGIVPDKAKTTLEARKKLSESLAVQFSLVANRGDFSQIETILNLLVERNPDVLSAAMRGADGDLFAEAGNHQVHWQLAPGDKSSPTHVIVPIFQRGEPWGGVEIRFASLSGNGLLGSLRNSFWGMILFVTVTGFVGYLIFMKRALRELDPSAVIPDRVKVAFDSLAEGVLILDEAERVVLANKAFSDHIGINFDELIGKKVTGLNWQLASLEQLDDDWRYPWTKVLADGEPQTGVRLKLSRDDDRQNTFMVNCSPILDDGGSSKGVLTTFDDVTQLELKNVELQGMLDKLEESQNEISRQNDKLKLLAEHDSLTGCYNRRALHARFNDLFDTSQEHDLNLSCIMIDIDHFKRINDTYGHQTGDKVIKLVADVLHENLRENDMVGRYGGEEFCLVLPGIDQDATMEIAERMRIAIMDASEYRLTGGKRVTVSLGVSSIRDGADNSGELVNQADKALYFAKNSGRNRVVLWSDWLHCESDKDTEDKDAEDKGAQDKNTEDTTGETTVPHNVVPISKGEDTDSEVATSTSTEAAQSANSSGPDAAVGKLQGRIKELEALSDEQMKTLQRRLNYDPVTGLPSRVLFHDRLHSALVRAKRTDSNVAVMSISATTYKRIHDTLGSDAADRLIVEISRKLSKVLRQSDTISPNNQQQEQDPVLSRHNSDDFYLLVPDLKDGTSSARVVNRVFEAFIQPLNVSGYNIQVNNSIGVSMFPADGGDVDTLLKHADVARLHAQESPGNNNCQFYSEQMNEEFAAQLETESELLRAIEYDEFELYYQPLLNAQQGRMQKLEALLRWNHPEKGVLAAAGFIEVAEGSGLISRIGDWVLRSAIRQLAVWRKDIAEDLVMSVNLSAIQLQQGDIVAKVMGYLAENNVPPENLLLEITETTMMENIERASGIMEQLHAHGLRIAIDDFGTGYSSLQHIQRFPVDVLKIDRSFIMNIDTNENDASIVSSVIGMARELGLTTVAEGVETESQFKILRSMHCSEMQGYLFSRPVSAEKAYRMLERQESHVDQSKVWLAS